MLFRKIILALGVFTLLNSPLIFAQNKRTNAKQIKEPSQVEKLKSDIEAILSAPDIKNAFIGVMIQSLDSNEVLYKLNEDKNFIPASVQKLFTSATALETIGADYRYNTALYLDGKIQDNGKFDGNIIIKGNGDPTFSKKFLNSPNEVLYDWASQLDSMGIRMITGNIIGDDRFFDSNLYGPGWAWDDVNYTYSAPIGALSFNQNQSTFTFKPNAKIGERAVYEFKPNNDYIRIINNVTSVPAKQNTMISISRDFNSNLYDFVGTISQDSIMQASGYTSSVAIDNPTLFYLHQFRKELDNRKIKFRGSLLDVDDLVDKPTYISFTPLFEKQSPPLLEILQTMNKQSDNFLAEIVLKTLAKEINGAGTFAKGADAVRSFALKCGAKPENINFVDGSGLSRMNFCSPQSVNSLLAYMRKSKNSGLFTQTLALPGENGTLKNRMTKSLAEGALKGKTGSMNGVCSIAGYVKSRDGEDIAFTIMFMNYTSAFSAITNIQDMICMRLAGFSRKK